MSAWGPGIFVKVSMGGGHLCKRQHNYTCNSVALSHHNLPDWRDQDFKHLGSLLTKPPISEDLAAKSQTGWDNLFQCLPWLLYNIANHSQTSLPCLIYWPLDKSKVWPLDTLLFVYSGEILSCQLYLCPLPGKYNIKQTFLSMSALGIIPCWADQFSSPHE